MKSGLWFCLVAVIAFVVMATYNARLAARFEEYQLRVKVWSADIEARLQALEAGK